MTKDPLSESYDIIIVGAGPAGSSAARSAAQNGARVLLVDRKRCIGVPVQCGEFVPQWISRYVDFSLTCVNQSVGTMVTHLPDQTCYEMKSPGYMLNRSLFDKELVTSAILSGASISIETKAVALSSRGIVIERAKKQKLLKPKVIIAADGVHSLVGRWIGHPSVNEIVALQYDLAIPKPQNHVDIFFRKDYESGYAWFFPKGRRANVGVGVVPSKTSLLPSLFNDFLKSLQESKKLSRIEIISKTGGSIPCEPRRQTVFGNILLVGDAAGHAHPVTGAGILNAVIGGSIAGRIAAEAIVRGDLGYLENYEREWRETLGQSLLYGFYKREFLEENWNKSHIDFESLIRKTWVGFKEYYQERRGGTWIRE